MAGGVDCGWSPRPLSAACEPPLPPAGSAHCGPGAARLGLAAAGGGAGEAQSSRWTTGGGSH
eukprot:4523780-Alexandrium_andersonii.AAC.1